MRLIPPPPPPLKSELTSQLALKTKIYTKGYGGVGGWLVLEPNFGPDIMVHILEMVAQISMRTC